MLRKRPDWSRPLPQPLQILDENYKPMLTLKTLGDVRKMLSGLPEPFQLKTTWGHVAVMLDEAARGGDIMDVVGAAAHGAGYGGHRVTAEIATFDGCNQPLDQTLRVYYPYSAWAGAVVDL